MNKCPNKSSEEWKLLVNIYGEAFATTLYEKNGEEIPDLETAQKLFSNLATLASNPGGIKSSPGTSSPKIDSKIVLKAIKNQQDNPYPTVREALVRQYSQLIRRLSNVRDQQRSTTNKEKRHQLSIKYADLSERLKKVKETLDSYKEVQNLDELTLILDSMVLNAQEILNLPELSHDDIEEAGRILNLLSLAGDFSSDIGGTHLIFSKEELESEALKYGYVDDNGTFHKGYSQYKEVADELNRKLNSIKEDYVVTTVQKQLNNPKLTKQQIFGALRDINYATARTLDGSDVNDAMVQTMYSLLNQSTIAAEMETRDRLATLEGLLKKTKQYGSFKELFAQKYKDGKLTGDLVSRFTPEFFDAKSLAREKAKADKNWSLYSKWKADNEIMFNVNLLFNEDGSIKESPAAEAHKKELISHLGIKGFNYYFAKQQERIELWNENKEAYKELLETKDWSTDSKEEAFRNWILETSPFLNADKVINGSASEQNGIQIGSRAGYYNIVVPRRYRKDNSQTGYYDDAFLKIEENEDLLSFYTYITNLLRDLKYIIPADQRIDFRSNTLPDIKTSVIATLNRGFGDRARSLIDTLKKGMTDSDVSSFDFDEYNLKTGEKIRKAKLTAINNRGQQIQEYIRLKELQLGRDATPEELIKWKKEIVTKLAENKSYDPETMLRVFTSQIMAYKYNSANESTLNILFEGLKSRKELRTNLAGRVLLKPDGTPAELEGGLRNLIDMVNYHWGIAYGEPRHKIEGKAKKKRYTTEEKVEMEKLKEIQHKLVERLNAGKITKEDFDKEYEFLEAKLNSLGGYITASALGDIALKWYTYLGMSFNFIAGGVNLFTGAFENSLRGMDGRLFSNADLWMFYGKVITSSIPGYSSEETKKIKAINAKLDITQMAVNELYDLTNSSGFAKWKKKVAVANPFYINERTEYINQMPLALAYINNKKVFSSKDESIKTFYDAIDVNGEIKEGVILVEGKSNQQALIELKQQLDRLIKITHGNYSSMSPMMGKQTIIGRALLQFRGWMPEMINARFGPELQDNILGITIKGRYHSFSAAFSHSIVAGQTYSALQNTLFTLKQILRKLTFQKTQFDQRLSEVDAANMRANLQELFILSAITALFFAIKGLIPDDDDEPKYFVNIFLNMLTRYQSDILLYLNPAEFEKISKNVLPVTGLITNFSKFMDASWKYLIDGDEEDWDRFVKRALGLFPILNQIPRTASYGSQLFS